MVKRESQHAQFIVVSLRKPMIENSDRTVGVTQRKNGISKVTGIQLRPDREPNPSAHHQDLSPTKRLSQRDEAFASMPPPPRRQQRIVSALN
jgi:hypothetical protein